MVVLWNRETAIQHWLNCFLRASLVRRMKCAKSRRRHRRRNGEDTLRNPVYEFSV